MKVSEHLFGTTADGTGVKLYRLSNDNGMTVEICTYGAIIKSIVLPDSHGKQTNVVLGYETLEEYIDDPFYVGAIVGRVCNRLSGGQFDLDGKAYQLECNEGDFNHLHGGVPGFNGVVWDAKTSVENSDCAVQLSYLSPHNEGGYPGNLQVNVLYRLTADNSLQVECWATTDQPTIVNLTQHSYFNLAGAGNILDHALKINAAQYTPADERSIPTGEFESVENTCFDFRALRRVGEALEQGHPQLDLTAGFDQNFVLNAAAADLAKPVAELVSEESGLAMHFYASAPGMHFYTGNFLGASSDPRYQQLAARTGLCLEAQAFPNTPNTPSFGSIVLRPGERYDYRLRYDFLLNH